MGFENSYKILKTKLFNKNFNSYGFEDYEFGYRLSKEGFNLKACSVLVVHNDLRGFYLYLNKIRFLGYQSMKYLVNINYDAAKNNNFFILENNFIIKFLLNFYFFKFLLNSFLKFFEASKIFHCIETDIVIDLNDKELYVYHPPSKNNKLSLRTLLTANKSFHGRLWLDVKNLNNETIRT
jgi:hypothetical protein